MECSLLSSKLPLLAKFNQSGFLNVTEVFNKAYQSICTEIGKYIMEYSYSPQMKSMVDTLNIKIKDLTSDQCITKFKSYSQNTVMLADIYKDQEARLALEDLIETTRKNIYQFTLVSKNAHIEEIKKRFGGYMDQLYQDTLQYITVYKGNIKKILDHFDDYFKKSKMVISPQKNAQCECSIPDSKCLGLYCFAGGEHEEVKEGLKINFCCPKCNNFVSQVYPNQDMFKFTVAQEYKPRLDELNTLINIFTKPCITCNSNVNSWNKIMMHCGCILCPPCIISQCRYQTNAAVIQNPTPKEIAYCKCKKPFDEDITKILLKDELEVLHRVLRLNSDRKIKKGKMYSLVCIKCGKEDDTPISSAQPNFLCSTHK